MAADIMHAFIADVQSFLREIKESKKQESEPDISEVVDWVETLGEAFLCLASKNNLAQPTPGGKQRLLESVLAAREEPVTTIFKKE